MKRIFIVSLMLFISSFCSYGQSIRKDYREMTSPERLEYREALMAIQQEMKLLGCLHNSHFTGDFQVHGDEAFLPWHRWFQYEFEKLLKSAPTENAKSLSVPYWNWLADTSLQTPGNWNEVNLLGNLENGWNAELKRDRMSFPTGGYGYGVNLAFNSNDFLIRHTDKAPEGFSAQLEGTHGGIHGYVSGIMSGGYAPYDPIFFFHHGYIDKLWQDWEELRTNAQDVRSTFTISSLPMHNHHYECDLFDSTNDEMHNGPHTPMINPAATVNSRNQNFNDGKGSYEAWYAYKGTLLLDGLGSDFVTSNTKANNYCYVAAQPDGSVAGSIHIGDVKVNKQNLVERDHKGGFIVGQNSNVEIHTVKSIVFHPGFKTAENAVLTASLVQESCFTSPGIQARRSLDIASESKINYAAQWNVYPNPATSGKVNFGKIANQFILSNMAGEVLMTGIASNHLEIPELSKGMYLLTLDGDVQKLIIK